MARFGMRRPGRLRRCSTTGGLGALTAETPTLTLAESAPDTKLLAVDERELKAVETNDAASADLFGLACARAAFGEKEIGVDAKTVRLILPTAIVIVSVTEIRVAETHWVAPCPS
jgi:hypothetical protein